MPRYRPQPAALEAILERVSEINNDLENVASQVRVITRNLQTGAKDPETLTEAAYCCAFTLQMDKTLPMTEGHVLSLLNDFEALKDEMEALFDRLKFRSGQELLAASESGVQRLEPAV